MKFLPLLLVFACVCGGAQAQQTGTAAASSDVDSLKQVVDQLAGQIKENQARELDDAIWKNRRKYFNLGYANQTLTGDGAEWKSDWSLFMSMGRTYYLHKKPIAKMIKFGFDWTYFDMGAAQYDKPEGLVSLSGTETSELDLGVMQADLGMHFGPSLTINPVSHLKVSGFFHVIPAASLVMIDDNIYAQFVPFLSAGGAIAFKVISIGVESRWGKATYKGFSVDEEAMEGEDGLESVDDLFNVSKSKLKTSSLRFYISFRF